MTDPQIEHAPRSAYDLLTAPTLSLTDEEVTLICADLRKRRLSYVQSGKQDTPHKPKPAKATASEKAAITADLLANLGLAGPLNLSK